MKVQEFQVGDLIKFGFTADVSYRSRDSNLKDLVKYDMGKVITGVVCGVKIKYSGVKSWTGDYYEWTGTKRHEFLEVRWTAMTQCVHLVDPEDVMLVKPQSREADAFDLPLYPLVKIV